MNGENYCGVGIFFVYLHEETAYEDETLRYETHL